MVDSLHVVGLGMLKETKSTLQEVQHVFRLFFSRTFFAQKFPDRSWTKVKEFMLKLPRRQGLKYPYTVLDKVQNWRSVISSFFSPRD